MCFFRKVVCAFCQGVQRLFLEISLNSEGKLVNEDFLESGNIILLVENKHGLLVIHGIHRTEGNRAVAVGYEDSVAGNACGALVSIGKSLYVGEKHQCQQGLEYCVFSCHRHLVYGSKFKKIRLIS